MEGAASGAGAAAAGLSVPAAKPIDKGQLFPTRGAARTAAETELAAAGRSIKNGSSSGRVTFHVVCKTCTSWFVKAQRRGNGDFKVTQVGKDHVNCVGGGRRPSANVVQPMIDQRVRANPKIGGPAIKRTLKTAGFDVSDRTSQRSKRRIATASRVEEADAVARIPSWCEAVERDCPGSVATVEMSTDQRFVRSFMMLGKAAYAAVKSVPKVVSMDAGHLKGSWNRVMYILSMKDSNNHIIHVAKVLADNENETNYRFLLDQTCKNDHIKTLLNSGTATFYTDGHRGSPPALAKVAPTAPVRTCLRHLITNINIKKMGKNHSAAIYKAAKMPKKVSFDEAMEPIKELYPANYKLLTSYPLNTWTHHATNSELVVQDSTTSNNAESTINAVGAKARALNPFHLMTIAEQTVGKLAAHAELKKDSPDVLVPFAEKFMENERNLSLKKHVLNEGLAVYMVQEHGLSMYANRVTTIEMPDADGRGGHIKCTCSVPSRWKLLCCEALAVLRHIGRLNASMAFVDSGYTLASYRKVHSDPNYPVALPVWSELERGSLLPPRPVKGQAGAPKKGPQPRARTRGRNDNCQRGRGDWGGRGGGGSGSGGGAIPPVHGMSNVCSYVGDLGVEGRAGAERPPARVWGPLAAQRNGTQETSQGGYAAGAGPGAGSIATPSLSQNSVDLS